MKRICCECLKELGEKEPLEDISATHGLCDPCRERLIGYIRDRQRDPDVKRERGEK